MTFTEFKDEYGVQLSEQQEAAVLCEDSEILLLAVPGAGKTTTLVTRIGYLMLCKDIRASKILTITYSKAAAIEMEERFQKKFGDDIKTPKFSTIHSMCVSILRSVENKYGISFPVLEPDNAKIVRRALYEAVGVWPDDGLIRLLVMYLTLVKNKMYTQEQIDAIRCHELKAAAGGMSLGEFYVIYENYKRSHNIMDFDDQLIFAYDALLTYTDVTEYFHKKYRYIGIDEAQDTSALQFEIVRCLAEGADSLFVVGDDDQSIYGFRGAEPKNILQFTSTYPLAKVLYIETNYRSGKNIIEAADRFVNLNYLRYEKHIKPSREEDGSVIVTRKPSEFGVYTYTMQEIVEAQRENRTLAVVARNNASFLPLVDMLNRKNIVVRRRDNFEGFFANPIVSGVLDVLRLAVEPSNLDAFNGARRRALKLYLSKKHIETLESEVKALNDAGAEFSILDVALDLFKRDREYIINALANANRLLDRIREKTPADALTTVFMYCSNNIPELQLESERLTSSTLFCGTLLKVAGNYKTLQEFLDTMKGYATDKTDRRSAKSCVTLTTIHSAKGLEFDKVLVLDAVNGILPLLSDARDGVEAIDMDPEEESRLFYVAVTRAINTAEFVVPEKLYGVNVGPSNFIERLTQEKKPKTARAKKSGEKLSDAEMRPGVHVTHTKFGAGVILSVAKNVLTIRFEDGKERRILATFCKKA